MDEPFGGLDPAQKIEMQRTAVDALDRDSASALVVTHDVQEALYLCHRIALFSAKTRSAPRLLENPFRGRALTRQLLAEPGYQELSEIAFQFYAGELL
jgi:ABC-type nitrate/sulfonate/bicarbonate transport system ATPase subunit